jgi:hypothetical protein
MRAAARDPKGPGSASCGTLGAMKKQTKKLPLAKQTIAHLSTIELTAANGAAINQAVTPEITGCVHCIITRSAC